MDGGARDATISACGRYRYELSRRWDMPPTKPAVFVMLNPSTADADVDDPTIRRCIGFAQRESVSGLVVVNLFAWRATDPDELLQVPEPVGPGNSAYVRSALDNAGLVVVACGALHRRLASRHPLTWIVDIAAAADVRLMCLGTTRAGWPRHPLYVRRDAKLVPWAMP